MGVEEDGTRRDQVEVTEGEHDVVDNGGAKGLWGSKSQGPDAGVGGVERASVGEPTSEDDEGDGGKEVEDVSTTVGGKSGRTG